MLFLALLVVHDLEVGVDHVGLLLGLGRGFLALGRALGAGAFSGLRRLRGSLYVGIELGARLGEAVERGLHPVGVVGLEGLLRVGELPLGLRLLVGGQLVARLLERLLQLVGRRVELVAGLDGVAALLV